MALPLMTTEQFFDLPEPVGDFTYELHFGELVKVGRAKKPHYKLQRMIRDILIRHLGEARWTIDIEMPYGLIQTYDARAADVGVVAKPQFENDDDYIIGSPVLVVEVKGRSNRDRKMEWDAIDHITHGAAAVWLIKPERREIVMITSTARTVYGSGQQIELPAPLSAAIPVDEIFSPTP